VNQGADPGAARIVAVLIADQPDRLVSRRVTEVEVTLEGLRGDKHAGFWRAADGRTPQYPRGTPIRNDRQVSLVSREELELLATRLGIRAIEPEWLGANLLLEGVPELSLFPCGTRLRCAAGVVFVVQAENMPCLGPGRVLAEQLGRPELTQEFPRAALHLRGVVAVVEHAGTLRAGEAVTVSRARESERKG